MPTPKQNQMESHDNCGVESARIDWNEFADGYGNNVGTGDKSMQRMVEAGVRNPETFEEGVEPKAYDTEPCMKGYPK